MLETKFWFTDKELPQRSELWLEARSKCIGASDAATILNLNPYDTPHKLWKRKVGKIKKKENSSMKRGAEMEDEAAIKIQEELSTSWGINNPKIDKYFAYHPKYDFIGVSFDGVDLENKFITEIKCPKRHYIFKSVFEDGIQEYYYPQVQLQLFVSKTIWGIDKAFFCSYYPEGVYILGNDYTEYFKTLAIIEDDCDEEYCEAMVKVAKVFNDMVVFGEWQEEKYDEIVKGFNSFVENR